jgi:hypothetical protein|tara:strand:- start:308 stop:430 length:123 start_codon:yes stop_codon:yes gene_type:complete
MPGDGWRSTKLEKTGLLGSGGGAPTPASSAGIVGPMTDDL